MKSKVNTPTNMTKMIYRWIDRYIWKFVSDSFCLFTFVPGPSFLNFWAWDRFRASDLQNPQITKI